MPLDEFINEVMSILKTQTDVKEVCVKKSIRYGSLLSTANRGTKNSFKTLTTQCTADSGTLNSLARREFNDRLHGD